MKKTIYFTAILTVSILVLSIISCAVMKSGGLPAAIKVTYKDGVAVHETPDSGSPQVGAAYTGYEYKLLDARAVYYLVAVRDIQGWIYAGNDGEWVSRPAAGKIRILRQGGISLRAKPYDSEGPVLGAAAGNSELTLVDIEYSHYKIRLPDGKEGWIYGGKPGERRVTY